MALRSAYVGGMDEKARQQLALVVMHVLTLDGQVVERVAHARQWPVLGTVEIDEPRASGATVHVERLREARGRQLSGGLLRGRT